MTTTTVNPDILEAYSTLDFLAVQRKHASHLLATGYRTEQLSVQVWFVHKAGESDPYRVTCRLDQTPESCTCIFYSDLIRAASVLAERPWACKHMALVYWAQHAPKWSAIADLVGAIHEVYERREARRKTVRCRDCGAVTLSPQTVCGGCKADGPIYSDPENPLTPPPPARTCRRCETAISCGTTCQACIADTTEELALRARDKEAARFWHSPYRTRRTAPPADAAKAVADLFN